MLRSTSLSEQRRFIFTKRNPQSLCIKFHLWKVIARWSCGSSQVRHFTSIFFLRDVSKSPAVRKLPISIHKSLPLNQLIMRKFVFLAEMGMKSIIGKRYMFVTKTFNLRLCRCVFEAFLGKFILSCCKKANTSKVRFSADCLWTGKWSVI